MDKTLKLSSTLAKELLGTNPALDAVIKSNFTNKELGLNITDRIKTYLDACKELEIDPCTAAAFVSLPEIDRVHAFASHRITTIIRALNEGWTPNWSDSDEAKYYVWYKYVGSGVGFSSYGFSCGRSASGVGSRLHFKTRELAQYFASQFITDLNEYFI